jgi:(p)ppGpp synthase/HD superfamily hydrolase
MTDPNQMVFDAVGFAARAHRHQIRKDQETPYVSHVFRVCLIARHVFGFEDPRMLATAILHDTIEDTATDCDDIIGHFGTDVARWVAALTKDMRLPHDEREAAYLRVLETAEWQVKVCKLADLYDNLADSKHLSVEDRNRTIRKSRLYLNAVRVGLPPIATLAAETVERRLAELQAGP